MMVPPGDGGEGIYSPVCRLAARRRKPSGGMAALPADAPGGAPVWGLRLPFAGAEQNAPALGAMEYARLANVTGCQRSTVFDG